MSDSSAFSSPDKQVWNDLYRDRKDRWTNKCDHELLKFYDVLTNGSRDQLDILVPMCGKTQAMLHFTERGHRVVGIDWSEVAIEQFFEDSSITYSTQSLSIGGSEVFLYETKNGITLYCGDIFDFKQDNLGCFDCIYDHGSIGSFNTSNRAAYAQLMNSFTKPGGKILLSFFDYEHSEHPSMPFAVTEKEITGLYGKHFSPPELLHEVDMKMADIFKSRQHPDALLPVGKLSRCSWKTILLTKQ